MKTERYVIGIDYGTDSVRALIVNGATGAEEATEVVYYPRWAEGKYCNPEQNQFRQHPLDYLESLEAAVRGALAKLPPGAGARVAGIGVDTTGSTPGPVDQNGMPLALTEGFEDNPNAMFVLWKDHTAVKEAEAINRTAKSWGGPDYTQYEGGVYSSEWFWAKMLHILRTDPAVRNAAWSWVEHCDWIPAVLTGTQEPGKMKRSRCAAGHKAMWHQSWNGLPPEDFLVRVDPLFAGIRERLYTVTYTSDRPVGGLTTEWADKLGLSPGVPVAVGGFDSHMGAVGGGIGEATLVKIMGTSTCDIMVAPYPVIGDKLIAGICGQVDGSVIPGMIGLEAGQSALGDVYAWFRQLLAWPLGTVLPEIDPGDGSFIELGQKIMAQILPRLDEKAAQLAPGDGLVALDWLNGRRTPYADQTLKGAVMGLRIGTSAPRFYRGLVEATAFGAKAIVDRFEAEGVQISQVIAMGGIAKKSPLVMQVTADVFNMPIRVAQSEQACALGAAIFGALAAGMYTSVQEAQEKMGGGFSQTYRPTPENVRIYREWYQKYLAFGKMMEGSLREL